MSTTEIQWSVALAMTAAVAFGMLGTALVFWGNLRVRKKLAAWPLVSACLTGLSLVLVLGFAAQLATWLADRLLNPPSPGAGVAYCFVHLGKGFAIVPAIAMAATWYVLAVRTRNRASDAAA